MPEHDYLSDERLDAAFDRLAREVGHRPGPGAAAAIRTARRRRTTGIAAVAASVALAVGAGALTVNLADDPPEVRPAEQPLPAAAPLDQDALSVATEGWASGWTAQTDATAMTRVPICESVETPGDGPEPDTFGVFTAGRDLTALVVYARVRDPETRSALRQQMVDSVATCPGAQHLEPGLRPEGATVDRYAAETSDGTDQRMDVWVTEVGDQVGMLVIGSDAGGPGPEVDERVTAALVAGTQEMWAPGIDDVVKDPSSGSTPLRTLDQEAVMGALGSWTPATTRGIGPTTPCLDPSWIEDAAGFRGSPVTDEHISVMSYAFPEETSDGALITLGRSLVECNSVQVSEWSLGEPAPGVEVTIYTYDRGGRAGHGALWVAVSDGVVATVEVDQVGTTLPGAVAHDVAAELAQQIGS